MKRTGAFMLVGLLLGQTLGLGVARLWVERACRLATPATPGDGYRVVKMPLSLPYTTHWDNPDGREGLVQTNGDYYNITTQTYQNDTLYTVLKTNRNARERFTELAEAAQASERSPKSPLARAFQLLKDFAPQYLLSPVQGWLGNRLASALPGSAFAPPAAALPALAFAPPAPPPRSA